MLQFVLRSGIVLLVVVFGLSLVPGCSDSEKSTPSPLVRPSVTPETPPDEDVVITIGNLSDLTGVSANALEYINMALDDLVEYYNDNNFIPGIRLEVVTYDGQMDPARDMPGYEWLREKGADLIFTPIPAVSTTLKPRVDRDEVVLFALSGSKEGFLPPGYVFNLGVDSQYEAYTVLKWIAENDWDYQTKGPARIGGAGWNESYSVVVFKSMEEYTKAHPDQFEWKGGYLTNFSFNWGPEVEALRDNDYIWVPNPMINFVRELRDAESNAKLIGTDLQVAFFELVDDAHLWEEIDSMLFLRSALWWNEEGEIVNLAKQILHENRPSDAEKIIASGSGYLVMHPVHSMLTIIADAAEAVGPQNLDSQAIYDAATSLAMTIEGVQRFSFSHEKRDAVDSYAMYEARATEKDIFRRHDEWYPTVRNP